MTTQIVQSIFIFLFNDIERTPGRDNHGRIDASTYSSHYFNTLQAKQPVIPALCGSMHRAVLF